MVDVGEKAPDFCLDGVNSRTCLSDFRGKWVVVYFYPRDNTRGCTQEAKDFTAFKGEFEKLGAVIIGISPDSVESHKRFAEKHGLDIILLSDPEKKVIEEWGAWGKKRMGRREYFGVIRSTFIVDPEGVVRAVWRNVRVRGHVEKVLDKLKELVGSG